MHASNYGANEHKYKIFLPKTFIRLERQKNTHSHMWVSLKINNHKSILTRNSMQTFSSLRLRQQKLLKRFSFALPIANVRLIQKKTFLKTRTMANT